MWVYGENIRAQQSYPLSPIGDLGISLGLKCRMVRDCATEVSLALVSCIMRYVSVAPPTLYSGCVVDGLSVTAGNCIIIILKRAERWAKYFEEEYNMKMERCERVKSDCSTTIQLKLFCCRKCTSKKPVLNKFKLSNQQTACFQRYASIAKV